VKKTCRDYEKWRTPQCEARKYDGKDAGLMDWCPGYKEKEAA